MEKIVLIDGNNLMFRSYYATAYTGNTMKNSKGFPTNALYGFANMINKILNEDKPNYILVAFDKGKTFRHDNYHEYKAGRIETPTELKQQFSVAKEMLDAMGIKWFEIDGYEADDIIGTFSSMITNSSSYEGLIISSDRDLLQLINDKIKVKLLKTKDYIMMDRNTFIDMYGIEPIRIIDLKGLQGDSSDNIPGISGIGEKTALKLLKEYGSIENMYVNLDKIKGKLFEKLNSGKDSAFMSKQLATIFKEVPIGLSFEDIKYKGPSNKLKEIYQELEFYSFIKNLKIDETHTSNLNNENCNVKIFNNLDELNIENDIAVFLEVDNLNYHSGNVIGMGIHNEKISGFIPISLLREKPLFLNKVNKYTYDLKKNIISLSKLGINTDSYSFDTMIAGYLLNLNVKDDISYMGNTYGYNMEFQENLYKKGKYDINLVASEAVKKARFIYETHDELENKLNNECMDLYKNIELPLVYVLADMELTGMKVDVSILDNMKDEIGIKLELLKKDIYNMAGGEFNINSPKQLGDILYDKIGVPANKKRTTDKEYLSRYRGSYPIVDMILEYKMLSKIYSTYIVGLEEFIHEDKKIHTIFNQTLTRTGRLSSSYPNLQNIPTRYEYAKLIRKAFVPENDYIMSSDYSQIELRILAHLSKVPKLIEAFKSGVDIHTKTAMEIFKVSESEVNSEMRRQAKAVNFGILYGISGFGLSENLDMSIVDARDFINKYFEAFPGIKEYMDTVIESAKKTGYVKTLMERKRTIDELYNTNYMIRQTGERIALNTPIQGSSADIIKKAMIDLFDKMKDMKLKSKMVLQIHDELIFDVVKEEEDILKKLVKEVMENTCELDVPLEVEVSIGTNWYEAK